MRFTVEKVTGSTDDVRYIVTTRDGEGVECRHPDYSQAFWTDEQGTCWRFMPDIHRIYLGETLYARGFGQLNMRKWSIPGVPTIDGIESRLGLVFLHVTAADGKRVARVRFNRIQKRRVATVVMKGSFRPILPVVICMAMGMLECRS